MSREIYRPLDYVPDEQDSRDWLMKKQDVIRKLGKDAWIQMKKDTPDKISHRPDMSAVKDQGDHPRCVGFAVAAVVEWFAMQRFLKLKNQAKVSFDDNPFSDLSERWLYDHAEDMDRFPGEPGGTSIKAALKVLQKKGVPVESAWSYHEDQPENYADKCADLITIDNYYRVKTGSIRDHIWALFHNPIPIAIEVYPELYNPDSNGMVELPGRNSRMEGLHAVTATGYDKKDGGIFEIKNSWGSDYGDNGYCYLPRKYLHRHEVAAWSFNRISSFNPDDIRNAVKQIEA